MDPAPVARYQPTQRYDMNTERVALQRRLPELIVYCCMFQWPRCTHHSMCVAKRGERDEKEEDDMWVVPHNLYLAVYSPSSVNVLAFRA